jgi:hypothetical protein
MSLVMVPAPALMLATEPLFEAMRPPLQFAGSFQLPPAVLIHVPSDAKRALDAHKTKSITVFVFFMALLIGVDKADGLPQKRRLPG